MSWKKELMQIFQIMSGCVLALSLIFLLVTGMSMFLFQSRDNAVANAVEWIHYRTYETVFAYDPFVEQTITECNSKDSDLAKIYCVNDMVASSTEYVLRSDKKHRSPTYFTEEGGVCRDYAATYCTIFKRMDIECNYITRENEPHILAYVWAGQYLCLLDNDELRCN